MNRRGRSSILDSSDSSESLDSFIICQFEKIADFADPLLASAPMLKFMFSISRKFFPDCEGFSP